LQLNGLHGVTSQKRIIFITTAVKTSNPTRHSVFTVRYELNFAQSENKYYMPILICAVFYTISKGLVNSLWRNIPSTLPTVLQFVYIRFIANVCKLMCSFFILFVSCQELSTLKERIHVLAKLIYGRCKSSHV
jgi:hypothetical protein